MADYTQLLQQLKNTEKLFQRETQPYKDFRDALKNLNDGMRKAGNRALSAMEVQKLRELAAKAKEAWDIYSGNIWRVFNDWAEEEAERIAEREEAEAEVPVEEAEAEAPRNPLPALDRRRIQILNGVGGLLEGDLNALRNYDPARGLTLPQIIDENRGLSADVRGKEVPQVQGGSNSRMVLEVNGAKGVFTEGMWPCSGPEMTEPSRCPRSSLRWTFQILTRWSTGWNSPGRTGGKASSRMRTPASRGSLPLRMRCLKGQIASPARRWRNRYRPTRCGTRCMLRSPTRLFTEKSQKR